MYLASLEFTLCLFFHAVIKETSTHWFCSDNHVKCCCYLTCFSIKLLFLDFYCVSACLSARNCDSKVTKTRIKFILSEDFSFKQLFLHKGVKTEDIEDLVA